MGRALFDRQGRLRAVSPSFANLVKRSVEQLTGTPVWDLHPEMNEEDFPGFWERCEIGDVRVEKIRVNGTGEHRRPFELHTTRFPLDDSVYGLWSLFDPEGGEDPGNEPGSSLYRLTTILESVAEGILVVNADNELELCNRKFAEMWDVPVPLLLGSDPGKHLVDYLEGQVESSRGFFADPGNREENAAGGTSEVIRLKDDRILEAHLKPFRIRAKRSGYVWSFRDVTARKQAEEKLRESEQQFRQLAENIQEAFWLMDARSGNFLYFSPRQIQIWGRSLAPFYENPEKIFDIVHPDDRERMEEFLSSLDQNLSQTLEVEYRILRPDDTVVWLRNRAFPVQDQEGNVYRIAGLCEDVTEKKQREKEWRHKAFHDELTGLPTRELFLDRLNQNFKRMLRDEEYHFAVMFMDVDEMKSVNDQYGHDVGDQVLKLLARRLERMLRSPDTVARVGGDEFLLLAEGTHSKKQANQLVERIRDSLQSPFNIEDPDTDTVFQLTIRVSIGVALTENLTESDEAKVLVRRADQAMYGAKRRNKLYHFYEPEPT